MGGTSTIYKDMYNNQSHLTASTFWNIQVEVKEKREKYGNIFMSHCHAKYKVIEGKQKMIYSWSFMKIQGSKRASPHDEYGGTIPCFTTIYLQLHVYFFRFLDFHVFRVPRERRWLQWYAILVSDHRFIWWTPGCVLCLWLNCLGATNHLEDSLFIIQAVRSSDGKRKKKKITSRQDCRS